MFHVEHAMNYSLRRMWIVLATMVVSVTHPVTPAHAQASESLKTYSIPSQPQADSPCLGAVQHLKSLNSQTKEYAVVIHGLNNNVGTLMDISLELQKRFHVEHLSLPGHHGAVCEDGNMQSVWLDSYNAIVRSRGYRPSVIVGFSLGALIPTTFYSLGNEDFAPIKMILISPAIRLNYSRLFMHIGAAILPNSLLIPSLAPKPVQEFDSIPISYYVGLRDLEATLSENSKRLSKEEIPTLVIINPKDKVVSYSRTTKWIEDSGLKTWATYTTAPGEDAQIKDSHLIVSKTSLGAEAWHTMVTAINEFIDRP